MHMTKARLLAATHRPATDTFGESWDIRYVGDDGEVIDASTSEPEIGTLVVTLPAFTVVHLGVSLRPARRKVGDTSTTIYGAYRPKVVLGEVVE